MDDSKLLLNLFNLISIEPSEKPELRQNFSKNH